MKLLEFELGENISNELSCLEHTYRSVQKSL